MSEKDASSVLQHAVENANGSATKEAKGYRTHKIRSSGGFLLQETLRDAASHDGSQSHHRRQSRLTPQSHRTRGSPRPSEKSGSSAGYDASLPCNAESPSRGAAFPPQHDASHGLTVRKRHVPNGKAVEPVSPPRAQNQGFEMDSAQIVNMALNLSESRRLASRRNASNAVPPTLAPLPDSATGGSLRQHLNQQRRTSRNISPRPGRAASPRLPPGSRINTPLQASFDLGREGSYRYQFSPSTLARAQKAKEHLELMAQYRRMLELYIRNRKVRARERKAIDGEAQGFSDVKKVTDWVDNVARWAATGQSILPDGPSLPPFADADMHAQATSPSANAVKPKRPKVDWLFEPADLIADAYWLEQDNHLQLIEDRHWRRIFPPSSNLFRPLTGQTDMSRPESLMTTHTRGSLEIPLNQRTGNPRPIKTDSEHSHSSARERARQKLHELKGLHHRHGSHSHSDIRRLTKAPHSDLSDSEEEGKERRMPQRTFTGNSRDILEKQMLEMIAREARENGSDTQSVDAAIAALLTPERGPPSSSQPATREQSRKQSLAEGSESDDTPCKTQAQAATLRQRVGRSSLEIPMPARRTSFDLDASLPNSPDNHPHGYSPFIPTIGSDLSALPSRAGSPTRNPFHKVKSIFRERSKERGSDPSETRDGDLGPPIDLKGIMTESPQPISETPERRGSRSPPRNLLPRQPTDTYRAGPKRRSDESGAKGLFKGARLDTLIREGASKLGDFIWRKDSEQDDGNQSDGEATATDESDAEPARGRRRANLSLSRTTSLSMRDRREAQLQKGKHYLDQKPSFWPAIAQFSTNPAQLRARSVAQVELYQLAARTLSSSMQRALWLGVEWGLVGIMWYVWFVVMILRVFVGFGKGVVGGVRWLLWLEKCTKRSVYLVFAMPRGPITM
ncbi:Dual specificity protein kinase lkh1 [Verticillium dahliae VDG1]|nr:Dual specificity protein kinase lkh1 [Verticillium dahliae VDG1]